MDRHTPSITMLATYHTMPLTEDDNSDIIKTNTELRAKRHGTVLIAIE